MSTENSPYEVLTLEFVLEKEAFSVLEKLKLLVKTYGVASVADYLGLAYIASSYLDTQWGWTDLSTASISKSGSLYTINLPDPAAIFDAFGSKMDADLIRGLIAKRYARITGDSTVGLLDMLNILTGPDMLPLLEELIAEKKRV
jgi:hypothetical protein